jgi:SH3-like domain-containing protein
MKSIFWFAVAVLSSPVLGQAICTQSKNAILRTGPGEQFEKSWSVSRFMPFMKLDQKNNWLKLSDIDGEIHWGKAADFSTQLRCVVIKSNYADTHQGPGNSFPPVEFKTLDRFTPLKRIDAEGPWIKVESDNGIQFWVHESKLWRAVKVQSVKF